MGKLFFPPLSIFLSDNSLSDSLLLSVSLDFFNFFFFIFFFFFCLVVGGDDSGGEVGLGVGVLGAQPARMIFTCNITSYTSSNTFKNIVHTLLE